MALKSFDFYRNQKNSSRRQFLIENRSDKKRI